MNKKENLKQLASYHLKLLKDGLMRDDVEGIHYIQLGWISKVVQIPWTTASQPPLTAMLK
jgi:hypothetical protein